MWVKPFVFLCTGISSAIFVFIAVKPLVSLVSFATLALLSQMLAAIAQGRTFRLTKGDLTAEVVTHARKLSCLILSFLSKTLQSYDNIMKL